MPQLLLLPPSDVPTLSFWGCHEAQVLCTVFILSYRHPTLIVFPGSLYLQCKHRICITVKEGTCRIPNLSFVHILQRSCLIDLVAYLIYLPQSPRSRCHLDYKCLIYLFKQQMNLQVNNYKRWLKEMGRVSTTCWYRKVLFFTISGILHLFDEDNHVVLRKNMKLYTNADTVMIY